METGMGMGWMDGRQGVSVTHVQVAFYDGDVGEQLLVALLIVGNPPKTTN